MFVDAHVTAARIKKSLHLIKCLATASGSSPILCGQAGVAQW